MSKITLLKQKLLRSQDLVNDDIFNISSKMAEVLNGGVTINDSCGNQSCYNWLCFNCNNTSCYNDSCFKNEVNNTFCTDDACVKY